MTVNARRLDTPIGPMLAVVDGAGALRALEFLDDRDPAALAAAAAAGEEIAWDGAATEQVARQLAEYFAGARRAFDLPLAPRGTPFQQRVWRTLSTLGWAETVSYKQIAERIGAPAAVRAVGRANGSNPIPVVVPCHRVIGADGSLTGYGGGLPRKRWLLAHEGVPIEREKPARRPRQASLFERARS